MRRRYDEIHLRLGILWRSSDADLSRLHILSLAGKDAVLAKTLNGGMKPTPLFHTSKKHRAPQHSSGHPGCSCRCLWRRRGEPFANTHILQILRGWQSGVTVQIVCWPSIRRRHEDRPSYSGSTQWNNSVRSRMYFTRATCLGQKRARSGSCASLNSPSPIAGKIGQRSSCAGMTLLRARWSR